ncbi:MAG: DUF192 domain-containing protein [Planctomycetes bacterium]|nr:DUF192 domain-containing protein [Planctomycetota bacterium]
MFLRIAAIPLLFVLLVAAGAIGQDDKEADASKKIPKEEIVIGEHTFKLEVAANTKTRAKGLMGREKIDEHGGMIFIYKRAQMQSFWMKNCLVDIDLLYLDGRGRIVSMHKMKKEPPRGENESVVDYERRLKRYPSRRPAQFIIELKPGSIDRLKPKVGQTIELDLPRLRQIVVREERAERQG